MYFLDMQMTNIAAIIKSKWPTESYDTNKQQKSIIWTANKYWKTKSLAINKEEHKSSVEQMAVFIYLRQNVTDDEKLEIEIDRTIRMTRQGLSWKMNFMNIKEKKERSAESTVLKNK